MGKLEIQLRPTTESDLDFVLAAERAEENCPFVNQQSREQHRAALSNEEIAHLIVEPVSVRIPVGYVIMAGRKNENQCIEFRRLVITEKGRGYGRAAVRLVQQKAFNEFQAHRLWLDVKERNDRARRLYEEEGFVVEGTLRESVKGRGGWESMVIMSMLRSEFERRGRGRESGKVGKWEKEKRRKGQGIVCVCPLGLLINTAVRCRASI